jgi:hypothetical protein
MRRGQLTLRSTDSRAGEGRKRSRAQSGGDATVFSSRSATFVEEFPPECPIGRYFAGRTREWDFRRPGLHSRREFPRNRVRLSDMPHAVQLPSSETNRLATTAPRRSVRSERASRESTRGASIRRHLGARKTPELGDARRRDTAHGGMLGRSHRAPSVASLASRLTIRGATSLRGTRLAPSVGVKRARLDSPPVKYRAPC